MLDLAALAQSAETDLLAEAKAALEAEGYVLAEVGGAWVIDGVFTNPVRVAARRVTDLDDGNGAAVVATTVPAPR